MSALKFVFRAVVVLLLLWAVVKIVSGAIAALLSALPLLVLLVVAWFIARRFYHVDLLGIGHAQSAQQQTPPAQQQK